MPVVNEKYVVRTDRQQFRRHKKIEKSARVMPEVNEKLGRTDGQQSSFLQSESPVYH